MPALQRTKLHSLFATFLVRISFTYIGVLLLLMLCHQLFPQRHGLLALSQVLAPLLFLPLLLVFPLAFISHRRQLQLMLGLAIAIFLFRFIAPLQWQLPVSESVQTPLLIQLWNLKERRSSSQAERACRLLFTTNADIVAFVEANPTQIQCERTGQNPYRYYSYHGTNTNGLLIYSRYPFNGSTSNQSYTTPPTFTSVEIQVGHVLPVTLILAHPPAPSYRLWQAAKCQQVVCYDTQERDSAVADLQTFIQAQPLREQPVILIGDFNLTDRELIYRDITGNLQDVHQHVGVGPGLTWGLHPRLGVLVALLRLDYMFVNDMVIPESIQYDCSYRGSDHCVVTGVFTFQEIQSNTQ